MEKSRYDGGTWNRTDQPRRAALLRHPPRQRAAARIPDASGLVTGLTAGLCSSVTGSCQRPGESQWRHPRTQLWCSARCAWAAQDFLYRQLRRWYELLILGQDPSTLIKPYTVFQNWHTPFRALRALWIQLVTAAVSLALVIALITLIIDGSSNAFLKALFGVLGVAGLSAATVQAGLKNTAQSLLTRLRQDAYTDLVAAAIAEAPGKPGADRQDRVVAGEIRKRTLTTAADAAVP